MVPSKVAQPASDVTAAKRPPQQQVEEVLGQAAEPTCLASLAMGPAHLHAMGPFPDPVCVQWAELPSTPAAASAGSQADPAGAEVPAVAKVQFSNLMHCLKLQGQSEQLRQQIPHELPRHRQEQLGLLWLGSWSSQRSQGLHR